MLNLPAGRAETIAEEYNGFVRAGLARGDHGRCEDPEADPASSSGRCLLIDRASVHEDASQLIRREVAFQVRVSKALALAALGLEQRGRTLALQAYQIRFPTEGGQELTGGS